MLFALFWRMATLPANRCNGASSPWHWLAVFRLIVQIALGALVGGSHAALSCPGDRLPGDDAAAVVEPEPWQVPAFGSPTKPWPDTPVAALCCTGCIAALVCWWLSPVA